MSLRDLQRAVGRLAIVGFSGTSVPVELRRMAAAFDLGGVIYFARNIEEPRQVAELSREIAALSRGLPLWISVDQEGGRVARLKKPFTEWPPMITLGRSGDEHLAARFARALADELRAVGINLDYAPVLDVRTNPANAVIGDRALAERADVVARLGRVIVRTLQAAGVTACGKHFPGHGDTTADSHEELPIADYGRDRLDAIELVPFVGAIAEEVATIMTAHVLVPVLDGTRPASLSPAIVAGLLKQELGFQGVVISDDLGMKAISATRSLAEASVEALQAGCDALLFCNSSPDEQVAALEAIVRAAESGVLRPVRLDDAFARQRRAKETLMFSARARPMARTIKDALGSAEHQAIAEEMAAFQ